MKLAPKMRRRWSPLADGSFWPAVFLIGTMFLCSCKPINKDLSPVEGPAAANSWPHDASDLLPDAQAVFGRLNNGLRYIIKENHTPRERVSMHLLVQVGSLDERPEEQGMAHFLEHMLFDGSAHFAPGELVKFFQRIGMQYGADANAHTGFTQTIYDVVLAQGDENSLDEGLLVLRDYADGALLLPGEVQRERRVVLAEMRARDSAQFRTLKAALRFEFPNLLIGYRLPIGEKGIIDKMTPPMLRDFYAAWYRPERMILVLVGDLNQETAKGLIFRHFANMKARRADRRPPAMGTMAHQGLEAFYHHEKASGSTHVSIETVVQRMEPRDSKAYQHDEMIAQLADAMIQDRLDALVQNSKNALTAADVDSGYYLRQFQNAQIEADCQAEAWQQAIADLEQTLRKAITFGFTTAELQRAKADFQARLLEDVQQESTRDSNTIARHIMAALDDWRVIQSARQRADLLLPVLAQVTLEQARQAVAQAWSADHRLVQVTGNADLGSGLGRPGELIAAAYRAAEAVPVRPPAEKKAAVFPYLPEPPSSGSIVQRRTIKDLGIEQVVFGNGFHLYLKATRYKENQVLAALSFGGGYASEPGDRPGLSKITQAVLNTSGFGALDRIQLDEALSGRLAQVDFQVREDMFVIDGRAATEELRLLFQLLYTSIKDPGLREDARRLVLNRFQQDYQSMAHTAEGLLEMKGQRFLAGGDPRFGAPPWAQLQQRSIAQMKNWFASQLNPAAMDLAVVGDFDVDRVVELAARYFGSLKASAGAGHGIGKTLSAGPEFPRGRTLRLTIPTDIPKALLVVAFPTDDFWDIQRTRRLTVLTELFSERLRERIRVKLGAAYSPHAFNHPFRAFKGYGMTEILVRVDPRKTETIVKEIRRIAEDLSQKKAGADEFRRVLDPTLTYISELHQKNAYWLESVLTGASRHPEQLDWSRTIEKDYASISADDILDLARRYLVQKNAAAIIISPQSPTATGPDSKMPHGQ
jgi:zinc protease